MGRHGRELSSMGERSVLHVLGLLVLESTGSGVRRLQSVDMWATVLLLRAGNMGTSPRSSVFLIFECSK